MAGFFIKSILIKILNFRVENFYFNRWISNLITFTYTSEKPNRRTSLVFNLKKKITEHLPVQVAHKLYIDWLCQYYRYSSA
jgi:hypothetical protein